MSDDKSKPLLSARAQAWIFAPSGLLFIGLGISTGVTGKLIGRSGAEMDLGPTAGWVVGSCFIALGAAIALSPLYYRPRSRT
jgi:hypothetical protein